MKYKVGQGILGKIQHINGVMPAYDRPYLIVKVLSTDIGILDVSSTNGKEHKLGFSSNCKIKNHNPPFKKPSFVKLDSYREVSQTFVDQHCKLLNKGRTLNQNDLQEILCKIK